jgi:hypothetical protein
VIDGFGNHIVHLSLISNGAEMETAHAQDGTYKAGATQRTFWRLWRPSQLEARRKLLLSRHLSGSLSGLPLVRL